MRAVDVHEISSKGVRKLFTLPGPELVPAPSKTDRLALDGAAAGTPAERGDEHPFLALSDPIGLDALKPDGSYLIKDSRQRILSVQNGGSGDSQYAYLGSFAQYPENVFPVTVSAPVDNAYRFSVRLGDLTWTLHATSRSTTQTGTFWANANYNPTDQPVMSISLKAYSSPTSPSQYLLTWNGNGEAMYLTADQGNVEGPSPYLVTVSDGDILPFSFHEVFVKGDAIEKLLAKEWPKAKFRGFNYGDPYFMPLVDREAVAIFADSGLAKYKWTQNVFDCDDFSYVYKATGSKAAYSAALECGYALGIVFGRSMSGAAPHAANVFIDAMANVKVIEPQNGQIVAGKDWSYTPYFVLF